MHEYETVLPSAFWLIGSVWFLFLWLSAAYFQSCFLLMFDLSGPHGTQNSSIVGQGKKNTYLKFLSGRKARMFEDK